MKPKESPELNPEELVALRNSPDALAIITARLRVKDMGPADHIRTKHEVKGWLDTTGTAQEAEAIIVRARARRELQETQAIGQNLAERRVRGQRMDNG
jgi:hypothetical protein